MFSELAKNDILRLRQQGYKLTDEEVIALNDLAVQIESGKDTTAVNHPRFAFAGNVVFHEPTVGALEWWWSYGQDASCTVDGKLHTYFFMLAHARDVELLQSLVLPKDINLAVKIWLKSVAATESEMFRALLYVKHGANYQPDKQQDAQSDSERSLDVLNQLLVICSGQSGIPMSSLKTCTETQLMSLIIASAKAGVPLKPSIAKQYIRYQQMVREIESRGVDNG